MFKANDSQDWEQVIVKKKQILVATHEQKVARSGAKATVTSSGKPAWAIENKVDNPEYSGKMVDRVGRETGQKIASGRAALKMTQEDLARGVRVTKNVINEIETGKAVTDKQLLANIRRVLGLVN